MTVNSETPNPATTPTGGAPADWSGKGKLAGVVTVLALAGFAVLAIYLLRHVGDTEVGWSRRIYVFAAIEAIAFAAVGWLFGREVHRERADAAETRASEADKKAEQRAVDLTARTEEATKFRERGVALKHQLRALAANRPAPPPHLQQDLAASAFAISTTSQLDAIAAAAEELFPDA